MRRWLAVVLPGFVVATVVALAGPTPASASASVSPGGATVTAGQGTSARASFSPSGAITCGAVSGGGEGVSATLDQSGCRDQAYSTTLRISTSSSAAPGTYTFTVQDTADGSEARFTLTVRAPATTTTAPPTTTPPPTTAAPTTVAPPTTAAPTTAPPTTAPPETTTTAPPTTTTAPVDAGAFAAVSALVSEGLPEEGVFLPLTGAGFRECLPLTAACIDAESAVMLLPARETELSWASATALATPLPQVTVRSAPPLQPVGQPSSEQPATVNYALTIIDLTDQGAPKSLPRGLNAEGELVAATADQDTVEVQATGVDIPDNTRTFIASQPFGKPSRLRTATVAEAAPAIPLFLGTQQRVVYGVKADPAWNVGAELIPLLGNGNVPYLVRTNDGATGLVVPIPPGITLSDRSAVGASADTEDEEDGGGGSSIVPILLGIVVLAALVAGGIALFRWRRQRMLEKERAATRARAESILQSQPRRFRRGG